MRRFETGGTSTIEPNLRRRLKMQLAAIDSAQTIEDINIIGIELHLLKGNRDGVWSELLHITVNGNWRITFELINGNAIILNYQDYHE